MRPVPARPIFRRGCADHLRRVRHRPIPDRRGKGVVHALRRRQSDGKPRRVCTFGMPVQRCSLLRSGHISSCQHHRVYGVWTRSVPGRGRCSRLQAVPGGPVPEDRGPGVLPQLPFRSLRRFPRSRQRSQLQAVCCRQAPTRGSAGSVH